MFPSVAFNPFRLLVVCGAITLVAVAAAYFCGHLMVGVFFGVGLLLGLLNALLVRRSVASITAKEHPITAKEHPMKSTMALNSATRLAIITVISLVIAYIFRPAGLGVVFGLALFQVVLVLSTALPVWKKLRAGDWAESASEGTERGNTSDE